MEGRELTSAIVRSILKVAAAGAVLSLTVIAPNAISALEKPLKKYFDNLDEQGRDREIRRVASYMKSRGLLDGNYQHGLQITEAGRQRLARFAVEDAHIDPLPRWDHIWRIVFYDIPEQHKSGRDALTRKLQSIGFEQLQRSVLIHPFPCRQVIESITATHQIDKFVTYIETPYIDNQKALIANFKKRIPNTIFD